MNKPKIKKFIWPLVLALLFALSLIFDRKIASAIRSARVPWMDAFFNVFLLIEKDIIFYSMIIVLAVAILAFTRKKSILPFLLGTGAAMLAAFLLKISVARERPFANGFDSFPSGHATAAFAPLSFLAKGARVAWLVFACLLAFTRLWFGIHYLSDIVAGAAIGYYVPVLVSFIFRKWRKR